MFRQNEASRLILFCEPVVKVATDVRPGWAGQAAQLLRFHPDPPAATMGAQTAPGEIAGHKIRVPGEKVDGTTEKLSEVEAEMVARLPPQGQTERLLQYAISHHVGATDESSGASRAGEAPSSGPTRSPHR